LKPCYFSQVPSYDVGPLYNQVQVFGIIDVCCMIDLEVE